MMSEELRETGAASQYAYDVFGLYFIGRLSRDEHCSIARDINIMTTRLKWYDKWFGWLWRMHCACQSLD